MAELAAFLVYLSAHGLRAGRFWLLFADSRVSLRTLFLVFYLTAVVGYFIPVAVTEIIRLIVLCVLFGEATRVTLTYTISRAFDFLLLGAVMILHPLSTGGSGTLLFPLAGVLLALGAFSAIAILLLFGQLLVPAQEWLLRTRSGPWSLTALKVISHTARESQILFCSRRPVLVLTMTVTAAIWLLDVSAFRLVTEGREWSVLVADWTRWSVASVVSLQSMREGLSGAVDSSVIQSKLVMPQTLFALTILLVLGAMSGAKWWQRNQV